VLRETGVLEVREVLAPDELEAEGGVIVNVEYSSVQPLDSEMLAGKCGPEPGIDAVLGSDGVGTVARSTWAAFPEGTRVAFVYRRFGEDCGSWCREVALTDELACVARLPDTVAAQVAAAGLTASVLASACLRHFDAGMQLVLTGAAGAVGATLVQMALLRGIRVVALLRGTERGSWLMREYGHLGTLAVVDLSEEEEEERWADLASVCCGGEPEEGGGADGLLDGVGGPQLAPALARLVKPRGAFVSFGALAGPPDEAAVAEAVKARALRVIREGATSVLQRRDAAAQLAANLELMAAERLRPHAWQLVDWRDAMHTLVPQPPWSPHVSQLTPGARIGRILLKIGS